MRHIEYSASYVLKKSNFYITWTNHYLTKGECRRTSSFNIFVTSLFTKLNFGKIQARTFQVLRLNKCYHPIKCHRPNHTFLNTPHSTVKIHRWKNNQYWSNICDYIILLKIFMYLYFFLSKHSEKTIF